MFSTLIEGAINRVLRLDPETLRRLGELEGKVICLDLGADAVTLYVEPSSQGLRIRRDSERAADVTLRGSIPIFARLARTGIAAGELQISGDIDLGSRFKRVLEGIDLDWEEPLARVVGDVAAHQIGRAARAARSWGEDAARTLAKDTAEYFQEESRLLAPRMRVEEFLQAVDKLRADTDRLQKRIEQLQRGGR
jgi:ubiquinone biosynthesis accessory factor UbiJ